MQVNFSFFNLVCNYYYFFFLVQWFNYRSFSRYNKKYLQRAGLIIEYNMKRTLNFLNKEYLTLFLIYFFPNLVNVTSINQPQFFFDLIFFHSGIVFFLLLLSIFKPANQFIFPPRIFRNAIFNINCNDDNWSNEVQQNVLDKKRYWK